MAASSSPRTAGPIPVGLVEEIQREVAGFDKARIRLHGRRFLREQPDLARFLTTLTRGAPGPAVEFSFYVGCIVWKMFDRTYGVRLPSVSHELLVANFARLRGDMERFVGADTRFLERYLRNAEFMRQPHVVQFMVNTLLENRSGWTALSCEARGICLVVLLTAIEAMDEALEAAAPIPVVAPPGA